MPRGNTFVIHSSKRAGSEIGSSVVQQASYGETLYAPDQEKPTGEKTLEQMSDAEVRVLAEREGLVDSENDEPSVDELRSQIADKDLRAEQEIIEGEEEDTAAEAEKLQEERMKETEERQKEQIAETAAKEEEEKPKATVKKATKSSKNK